MNLENISNCIKLHKYPTHDWLDFKLGSSNSRPNLDPTTPQCLDPTFGFTMDPTWGCPYTLTSTITLIF